MEGKDHSMTPTPTAHTSRRVPPALLLAGAMCLLLAGRNTVLADETYWTVGETGLQVQNTDPANAAEIRAQFYDFDGRLTLDLPRPIGPGAATNFYLPQIERESGLVPQAYSLIVTSDRPVAAISRTEDRRTGAALMYANIRPATNVAVPLVMKAFAGQNSLVSVQNTDVKRATSLRVEVFRSGEAQPVKDLRIAMAAAASAYLDVGGGPELADLPPGFVGWLRLTSDTPVTAQASVHMTASVKAVAAFEGQPFDLASTRLLVPLIRRDWYGTTGIAVVNPSTTSEARVLVSFRGVLGACAGKSYLQGPVTLGRATGVVFYQGDGALPATGSSPLPASCAGSAEITATGSGVLATVIDVDRIDQPSTASAYSALAADQATRRLAIPLIRNHHTPADLVTGIQVANAATDGPATVSVHFVTVDGQSIPSDPAHTAVIPAGGAINWYLPQVPGIAAQRDLYGSALIDSDRPVLAVVSEASLNGKSDTAAYNAISLPNPTDGLAAGPFQLRGGAPQWLARPQVVQP
jgi:hypothetical protein